MLLRPFCTCLIFGGMGPFFSQNTNLAGRKNGIRYLQVNQIYQVKFNALNRDSRFYYCSFVLRDISENVEPKLWGSHFNFGNSHKLSDLKTNMIYIFRTWSNGGKSFGSENTQMKHKTNQDKVQYREMWSSHYSKVNDRKLWLKK